MMPSVEHVVLGEGVFSVNGVDVALTRGGGQFVIEREYRHIEADGDRGPVKGRTVIDSSVAKLTMNVLELLPANLTKFYPGMNLESGVENDTLTGTLQIKEGDYTTATWTGRTKGGKGVVITLENALNLENLDWSLVDKDEVIPALTYTATYDENARKTEPWKVEFAK